MRALASAVSLRRVVASAAARGVEEAALLDAIGVDRAAIDVPSALIGMDQLLGAYRFGCEALDDPCFGLAVAAAASQRDYGIMAYLLVNHPRLIDGIQDVARTYEALVLGYGFGIETRDDAVRIELYTGTGQAGFGLFAQDILGSIVFRGREATGRLIVPSEIEVVPPPDCDVEAGLRCFEDHLGRRPRTDTGSWAITLLREDVEHPMPSADPSLLCHLHDATVTMIARRRAAEGSADDVLRFANCVVDLLDAKVHQGERHARLTTKEVQILRVLAARKNSVVPHAVLEREVWGLRPQVLSHAPAVAIRRLRQKLEVDPSDPKNLVTLFGEGWQLNLT